MANATELLAAHILRTATDAERIRQNSAEHLWICRGVVPPKLPDPEPPKGEQNPLRRQDGKPIARKGMMSS